MRQWIAGVAVLLVVLGTGVYRGGAMLYEHASNIASAQLQSVAALKSAEIQRWLNDRLIFLSEPPGSFMARSLARLLNGRETAAVAAALDARFRHLHAMVPELISMSLYDSAGRPVASSVAARKPLDESLQAAARKARESHRAVIAGLYRNERATALDVLAPLIDGADENGPVIGYVLFQIDPERDLYPMAGVWPLPSATAEGLLVRREGGAVAFLSPLRHRAGAAFSPRASVDTPGFVAGRALQGETGALAGIDYRGEPVQAVALAIPGTDWVLITKMDDREVFEHARGEVLLLGAASLALLAAVLVLGRVLLAALRARAQERHYRMLAESGSDMVWLYDLATRRFTYVSPSVERLRGYTVAEGLQQTMQEVLTPASYRMVEEELPKWIAAFAAGGESLRTRHWEVSQTRKDGSTVETEAVATLIADAQGRVTHIQGISRDITDRRRIEATLAENEDKFRTIYDTISDGIFVHDAANGHILDVNASAAHMYGYERDRLLGLDIATLSAADAGYTQEAALQYIRLVLEQGACAFEWLARDAAGRQFWVAVNLKAFTVGGARRILAVVRNIDSRKRAEEALQRALAEAKALNAKLADAQSQLLQSEKMASIGQLAAGVAHELNNPIGFVSSNLNTLESYLQDIFAIMAAYEAAEAGPCAGCTKLDAARALKTEKDFGYLRTDIGQLMAESKEGLNRVAKIVRDLKDFSRAGEAASQWADLHQGLDSTLNIVWNELKYKCTVKKEYGELPPVWCVASQLNQVFMNLLVNAAHAIPEKGEITVRTGRRGDEVFVAVADTGTGIAPEHINRVFEPFFTTKPVGKGTGLGLSLAYSIVQKHGGRIEVQSEVGRGTTFTVWLPIEAMIDAAA